MNYGTQSPMSDQFAESKEQEESRSVHDAQRPVVLIVDDVPDNLLALEEMLDRDDIDILAVGSGREALEILLQREVALAILDVQMPEMDGFELAMLIRGVEKTAYTPIIFVTAGWRDQAGMIMGYEAGAVDYLIKPVDRHVLRSKVDVFVTLHRHRKAVEEANRMAETFIAVLGHDLRSPLSGILLSAQMLARCADGHDAKIEQIRTSGKRMARMIEHLLDATRFRQDGTVGIESASADLRVLAEQIIRELDGGSHRHRLRVRGNTNGTWDADRVQQVLSNLIGNALRHSPDDCTVTTLIDGRASDDVAIQVRNGGPPIPRQLRSVLFEPFRRSSCERRSNEGLGLGLYITKQLVEAHGGTISFTSDALEGTCFAVRLPRHVE